MNVILFCLCIVLAAVVWLLLKEVRGINLRLKDVDSRFVRSSGEMTLLDQRVVMLEELLAGPPAHEHA